MFIRKLTELVEGRQWFIVMEVLDPDNSAVEDVVNDGGILVPDDTVHKGNNCSPFGTQGILTVDIAIVFYTITPFSFFFALFVLHVYPQGRKLRGYCPHYTLAATFRYVGPVYTPPLPG